MMNSKLIFLVSGILLIAGSFALTGEAFSIQLYDTYFIIGWGIFFRIIGFLCCLIGGIFMLRDRQISRQQ
ncbi:hypothetical protein GCM10027592_48460 [Spirosoma flavus]